jgi:hypothetical protein
MTSRDEWSRQPLERRPHRVLENLHGVLDAIAG